MLHCYSLIDSLPNFTAFVAILKQWLIPANVDTIPQKVKSLARPRRKSGTSSSLSKCSSK
jgi:hypothetical protein